MTTMRVEKVAAEVTFPLRQVVLRPHETTAQLALPGDDDPESGHFAAYVDDQVVGTASVRREPPPWDDGDTTAWRLRGMATDDARRSQGIGAAVLGAAIDHIEAHGGGLLWCNARVPAQQFYERAGFTTRGEPWDDPVIGPHVQMHRTV